MYIGSSIDLGSRLTDHFVSGSSNTHLQYAMTKYGLAMFSFKVIELCAKELIIERAALARLAFFTTSSL